MSTYFVVQISNMKNLFALPHTNGKNNQKTPFVDLYLVKV